MKINFIGMDVDLSIYVVTGLNEAISIDSPDGTIRIDTSKLRDVTKSYFNNAFSVVRSREHLNFMIDMTSDFIETVSPVVDEIDCFPCWAFFTSDLEIGIAYDKETAWDICNREITVLMPGGNPSAIKVNDRVSWNVHTGVVIAIDDGFAWVKNDKGYYYTIKPRELSLYVSVEDKLRERLSSHMSNGRIEGILRDFSFEFKER